MVSTVKVSWSFNFNLIEEFGFEETANFSATFSPIEFYLRLTKDAQLSLRLATCPQEKLHIDKFKVEANRYQVVNEGRTTHCRTRLSGELTLDRSSKLSWQLPYLNNWKVDCKITYEEPLAMVHHRLKLADHLAAFRLNDAHTDVTLVTVADGMEHPAHKLILSMRSPVFATMFRQEGVLENVLNRVEIEEVTGGSMVAFLDYIYSGDTSKVGQFAGELFQLADKYDIEPLAQASVEAITVATAAQLYYLTDLHQKEDFKQKTMLYIRKNKEAVKQTNGWNEFVKPSIALLDQLISYL